MIVFVLFVIFPFAYLQSANSDAESYTPDWHKELLEGKYNATKNVHMPTAPSNTFSTHVSTYTFDCPQNVIHDTYGGHGYFFSWEDKRSADLQMTWSQSINFCRAHCLEPVSIESIKEHEFIAKHIKSGQISGAWTSGRKCDFLGCEREPFLNPIDIYGWFWEGTLSQLPPTTDRFDTAWSSSGPLGRPQPDNCNGQVGGEKESCLAILNNKYKDGIVWHDQVCSKRKPFICERKVYRQPQRVLASWRQSFEYLSTDGIV